MSRHNKKLAKKEHYEQLIGVTTIVTICELFCVTRTSVINAINTDKIAAVKDGKTWIVSLNSAKEFYKR